MVQLSNFKYPRWRLTSIVDIQKWSQLRNVFIDLRDVDNVINTKSLIGYGMWISSIDGLRFLRYGPSCTHCCRALTFASARLSCFIAL